MDSEVPDCLFGSEHPPLTVFVCVRCVLLTVRSVFGTFPNFLTVARVCLLVDCVSCVRLTVCCVFV